MTDFSTPIWAHIPTANTRHTQDAQETVKRDREGIPIDPKYTPKSIPEHCIRDYKLSGAAKETNGDRYSQWKRDRELTPEKGEIHE